jgi:hypothetical protein
MAGKTRYLLDRDGRFLARLVLPKDLRPYMDVKSDLRTVLGADRRTALRSLPRAVADLKHQIAEGECRAGAAGATTAAPDCYPLSDAQIALLSYEARLIQDQDSANKGHIYADVG